MMSYEEADRILQDILDKRYLESSTLWSETFATNGSETDTIARGLDALEAALASKHDCVLHGWIDQVALEIAMIGDFSVINGAII